MAFNSIVQGCSALVFNDSFLADGTVVEVRRCLDNTPEKEMWMVFYSSAELRLSALLPLRERNLMRLDDPSFEFTERHYQALPIKTKQSAMRFSR